MSKATKANGAGQVIVGGNLAAAIPEGDAPEIISTRSGDRPIAAPVTPAEIQLESDVQQAISNSAGGATSHNIPQMSIASPWAAPIVMVPGGHMARAARPSTRAECEAAMEAKHAHIDSLKVKVAIAQSELDGLIGLHNALPK